MSVRIRRDGAAGIAALPAVPMRLPASFQYDSNCGVHETVVSKGIRTMYADPFAARWRARFKWSASSQVR